MRLFLLLLLSSSLVLAQRPSEIDFNKAWCLDVMRQPRESYEFRLATGERIDCVVRTRYATYAVEMDWLKSGKQYEAIGQALIYAAATGYEPGVVYIARDERDCERLDAVSYAITKRSLDIRIWQIGYSCDYLLEP